MSNLSLVRRILPNSITLKVGRAVLKTQKNSPSILFGVGIVGFGATVIMSSRATLRAPQILDEAKTDLGKVNEVLSDPALSAQQGYDERAAQIDRVVIFRTAAIKLGKLYGPSVIVGTLTLAAFAKAHFTQNSRIVALTAAYSALERSFNSYRERVAKEVGADRELELLHDIRILKDEAENDGELVPVEKNSMNVSQYTRFFDESSKAWHKIAEYNLIFVRAQQNYANDMLRSRGYLFLNEVYANLGFEPTSEGQIVGWILKPGKSSYVDFGIFDPNNERARAFVNGHERSVMLTFNVDGIIYDQIEKF
jgi:hypothetical protein